jgi:hypothetical protein
MATRHSRASGPVCSSQTPAPRAVSGPESICAIRAKTTLPRMPTRADQGAKPHLQELEMRKVTEVAARLLISGQHMPRL